MSFYDINFIKKIKQNYGPEYARTCEIGFIAIFLYILISFIMNDFIDIKSILITLFIPLLAGMNKYLRDEKRNLKRIKNICFGKKYK